MITLRYVNYICTMSQRGRKTARERNKREGGRGSGSGRQTDSQAGGDCNLLSRARLTVAIVVVAADHC